MLLTICTLLEGNLLFAHLLVDASLLHRSLLVSMLLLLAHRLGGSEGHALAVHLALLLHSGTTLHEESLHDLALARVDESGSTVASGERSLAHLLHLLWLLLIRLRIDRLLAMLALER